MLSRPGEAKFLVLAKVCAINSDEKEISHKESVVRGTAKGKFCKDSVVNISEKNLLSSWAHYVGVVNRRPLSFEISGPTETCVLHLDRT